MRLNAYLRQYRLNRREFARLVGAEPATVSRWLKGRCPREDMVIAIYRVTKGGVTPNDFYQLPKLPGDAPAAQ